MTSCSQRVIACIRIAVPYTGMSHPPASQQVRERALWVFRRSAVASRSVGGYEEEERPHDSEEQFDVADRRSLDEVVHGLMQLGFIPPFCTAYYQQGRTRRPLYESVARRAVDPQLPCQALNVLMDDAAECSRSMRQRRRARVSGMELIPRNLKSPRD